MKHLDIEKYKNYSDFEIEGYNSLYKDIYSEFESVSPEKYNLKLLLISDTHGSLEYDYDFELFVKNNNYDLCIDTSKLGVDRTIDILEKYIRKTLYFLPLSFIYKLFRKKDIKVNRHWGKRDYIVKENDTVSIYIKDEDFDYYKLNKSTKTYKKIDEISSYIVYEDSNILKSHSKLLHKSKCHHSLHLLYIVH